MRHPATSRTAPRRHHGYLAFVMACIAMGAVLRVALAVRCGVGYDEVFVMGTGLEELLTSARAFFIDVPVRRSDAITPLWWWLQAVPSAVLGQGSLISLRVLPVFLGVATLVLVAREAPRRLGRPSAAILLLIVTTSDVVAFCNARGEFAESLLLLLLWPALFRVGDPQQPIRKGLLWLLLLMTHLGKGLFLLAGLGAAEMVCLASLRQRTSATRSLATSLAVAVVPVVAWLFLVQTVAFAAGPVQTDAGEVSSVWNALIRITTGYQATKEHMVAGPFAATQVYLDGMVWPGAVLWTVPLLAGAAAALAPVFRGGWRGRRRALAAGLVPSVAAGAGLVIGGGLVGARFHLLYWPALWVMAAMGLQRMWRRREHEFLIFVALAWPLHAAVALSWRSWIDRTLGLNAIGIGLGVVILAAVILLARTTQRRRPPPPRHSRQVVGVFLLAIVATGCLAGYGPVAWGPAARFEPMDTTKPTLELHLLAGIDAYRGEGQPWPTPHGRTLYSDLAHFHLSRADRQPHDVERAIAYLRRELRDRPDDPRAWFYLGLAYQAAGAPVAQVRQAWQRSYALNPIPMVAERLSTLPPD